ncbi:MAG: hypothetical protein E7514_02260 [Ruminococcaceae bacterium]|nr:hypothetical protein [Oscillospiraceae bacterium]
MENKQEKTQAELYREERKERLAKAAKKNARKSPQLAGAGKVIGKCLGIAIIIAVCLGIVFGCLNFFGVPQKVLTAMKVGDQKISVAKYNYYYMIGYTQLINTALQYENYGEGYGKMYTGFDYTAMPGSQEYLDEIEDVTDPTWADYLEHSAKDSIKTYTIYSKLAKEAGIELTDEQKADIDDTVASLKESATKNDYSLDRFIAINYGKGVTEKLMRSIIEDQYLAANYAEQKKAEFMDAISAEQVDAEFSENIADYTTVDIGYFVVNADMSGVSEDATDAEKSEYKVKAMAEAKAKADEYFGAITDDHTLLASATAYDSANKESNVIYKEANKTTVSNISEDAVKWVYANDRNIGDKNIFETEDGYAIVYIIGLPAKDTTKLVDVRHILIKFDSESDTPTDEEKQAAYAQAQEVYNKYLENPTEDYFAELAGEYTEDTGSKETGGLYENVYPNQMVDTFNDWIFDEARKTGDTDIVESNYGYHVMYYVSNDNPEYWYYECQSAIADKNVEDYNEKAENDNPVKYNDYAINFAQSSLDKLISDITYRLTSNASTTSAKASASAK